MVTALAWEDLVNSKHAPTYVGALLYWLEYCVRKREEQRCTSGPNQWLEPKSVKQVPYLELGT